MKRFGIGLLIVVFSLTSVSSGQLSNNIQPGSRGPWATPGQVASRSPGLMVQNGLSNYSTLHGNSVSRMLNGPTITQTDADLPTRIWPQAKAEMITTVFDQLTAMIQAYNLYLQTQAGQNPDDGNTTDPNATDTSGLLGQPTNDTQ